MMKNSLFAQCTLYAALTLAVPLAWADLSPPANAPAPAPANKPAATQPADSATAIPDTKDLTPVQRPMAEIAAPSSDLKVSAWVDRSDGTYRFGDQVVLNVKVDQDAYVTVLDVGTSGKVHVIFPNRFQKDNRVMAGEVIKIPDPRADFAFEVQGPAGTELLKVIATQGQQPLFEDNSTEPAGPYKVLKATAPTVAKDLQVVLREEHTNRWTEYDQVIRIVPPALSGQTPPPARPAVPVSGGVANSAVQRTDDGRLEPFGLHLRTERLVYPIGAKARVMVTAERDCALTLVDVGTSGKVFVLFPNRYQQDNRIRAGETVTIPGDAAPVDYQVGGPAGVEALIGICRTDNQPVYSGNFDFQQNVYQPWGDAKVVAKDLAVVLREPSAAMAHTATTFVISER